VKVLILGGTGFLGPFVVDDLLRLGHEVAVVSRREPALPDSVRRIRGDASDPVLLRKALRSWRPAALVDMLHKTPDHARAVAGVFAGRLERSVHLSCATVYGPRPRCPISEDDDLVRLEDAPPAVAAQVEADGVVMEALQQADLPGVLIRLPELYGPRDPSCGEWFFARRVLDGRRRLALPDGGLHICHRGFVQNMASGIAKALTARRAVGQVYNLGEEKLYTLAQLAEGVARALDHEWELFSVPGHLWTTPYSHTSFFDLRKARAQLRYRDVMIPRDGLEITLAGLCQRPRDDDWSWPGIDDPFDYAREDALIKEHGARLAV
jgi:nucleoside-diphosphate-sugar epimerase